MTRRAVLWVVSALAIAACSDADESPTARNSDRSGTDDVDPDPTDAPPPSGDDSAPGTTGETLPGITLPPITLPAVTLPTVTLPPNTATVPDDTVTVPPVVAPTAPDAPPASPLPFWLGTGTRVTWYQAAASIAQSRGSIVEDPACAAGGPGCYTDPQTGKFYRKTDEGPLAQNQPGASGDGFTQVDIVSVDGSTVAATVNAYVIDRTFNQLSLSPLGGTVVDGVSVPGAWVHPAELEQAIATGVAGFLVLLGDFQFGDRIVPSVSFVSGLGTNAYQSHTYDRETGVLVASNSSFGGPSSTVIIDGLPTTSSGNTQLTLTRLANVRQRALPGQDGAVPSWVADTRSLYYVGTYNFTNPVDPSSANFTYEMDHTVTIGQQGASFVRYAAQSRVPGINQVTSSESVGGPIGVYWWDADALQSMQEGDVLDADPITNEQTVVSFRGTGANGVELVVIDSQLPGVASRSTYDMTGLLLAFEIQLASSGTTIALQLVDRT